MDNKKIKKDIFVWWYEEKNIKNFGDVLNPYIISKLSGLNVIYTVILDTICKSFFRGLKNLLLLRITIYDFINVVRSFFQDYVIVAIGSVIGCYKSKKVKVWGSGIINSNDYIYPADFLAVRGEYTRNRILELGYKVPTVMGDPALLLPLVYNPLVHKKYKLGIIPHYVHYKSILTMINNDSVKVINLFDDIETIIDNIKSCEVTISSSLHGIIVSHAYEIPCLWYDYKDIMLIGDNIKFRDYFSSVDLPEYSPYIMNKEILQNTNAIINNVLYNPFSKANMVNIKRIQKELLNVAPFKIKLFHKNI
jgi:hypothetical protein